MPLLTILTRFLVFANDTPYKGAVPAITLLRHIPLFEERGITLYLFEISTAPLQHGYYGE